MRRSPGLTSKSMGGTGEGRIDTMRHFVPGCSGTRGRLPGLRVHGFPTRRSDGYERLAPLGREAVDLPLPFGLSPRVVK